MTAPNWSSPGTSALLPCPFCNRQLEHDKEIEATRHPKTPYGEYCPLGSFSFASDRTDIINAWNARAGVAQAVPKPEDLWECSGCGTRKSMEQIKAEHPNALSCCPERKMGPVVSSTTWCGYCVNTGKVGRRYEPDWQLVEEPCPKCTSVTSKMHSGGNDGA